MLRGHQGFALARFTTQAARDVGQGIARDPFPGEPAHALVFGDKPKPIRKKLGRASLWQTVPPALHLGEGIVLFSDPQGDPVIRRMDGRPEPVVPGSPREAYWLDTATRWLAAPENLDAFIRPTVERAVALWSQSAT